MNARRARDCSSLGDDDRSICIRYSRTIGRDANVETVRERSSDSRGYSMRQKRNIGNRKATNVFSKSTANRVTRVRKFFPLSIRVVCSCSSFRIVPPCEARIAIRCRKLISILSFNEIISDEESTERQGGNRTIFASRAFRVSLDRAIESVYLRDVVAMDVSGVEMYQNIFASRRGPAIRHDRVITSRLRGYHARPLNHASFRALSKSDYPNNAAQIRFHGLPQRRKINVRQPHSSRRSDSADVTRGRSYPLSRKKSGISFRFFFFPPRSRRNNLAHPFLSVDVDAATVFLASQRRAIRAIPAATEKKGRRGGEEGGRKGRGGRVATGNGGCSLICRSLTIDPFRERSKR